MHVNLALLQKVTTYAKCTKLLPSIHTMAPETTNVAFNSIYFYPPHSEYFNIYQRINSVPLSINVKKKKKNMYSSKELNCIDIRARAEVLFSPGVLSLTGSLKFFFKNEDTIFPFLMYESKIDDDRAYWIISHAHLG